MMQCVRYNVQGALCKMECAFYNLSNKTSENDWQKDQQSALSIYRFSILWWQILKPYYLMTLSNKNIQKYLFATA